MATNFISVATRMPELFKAGNFQISDIMPVILKNRQHCFACLWNTTWRNAFTCKELENVTHWGELTEDLNV